MNYQAWTLVAVWLGVLITVAVTLRQSGARDQRQKDQEEITLQHRNWLLTHDTRLSNHDTELAENRGFREGLKAGKKEALKEL